MHLLYDNISNYNEHDYKYFFNKLSECDKNRIKQLVRIQDKKLYILSRILLIKLLNDKYSIEYSKLKIYYNSYGKPLLDNLYFNISHSQDYAAVVCYEKKLASILKKLEILILIL